MTWKNQHNMDLIIEQVENGMPLIHAARAAGIPCNPKIVQRWLKEDSVFRERVLVARRVAVGMAELMTGFRREENTWRAIAKARAATPERERAKLQRQLALKRAQATDGVRLINPAPATPPRSTMMPDRIAVPQMNINPAYYHLVMGHGDPPEFTGRDQSRRADAPIAPQQPIITRGRISGQIKASTDRDSENITTHRGSDIMPGGFCMATAKRNR